MRSRHSHSILIICMLSLAFSLWVTIVKAQGVESLVNIRLDTLIEESLQKGSFAGAVLLVARDGAIIHKRSYGYAQKYTFGKKPMANPERMTDNHLFDVASMTKVFATTFGIMLLIDKGDLALDDPIYTYIPSFDKGEKGEITIRHLLSHRAGLYPWKPIYYHASNKLESLNYIASLPLKYPVGKEYHYSDLGFMLLGHLIETVSGKTLNEYLRDTVYIPLGLRNTTFQPLNHGFTDIFAATSHGNPLEYRMVEDDKFGYKCDENIEDFKGWRNYTLRGEVNDGNSFYAYQGIAGHAGLFSTIDDLHILAEILINKGIFKGKVVVRPETMETFLTPDEFGNGLGWSLEPKFIKAESPPEGTFGHTGFTGCNAVIMPEQKIVILFLTNRQNVGLSESGYYPNLNDVRRKIVEVVIQSELPPSGTTIID